MSRKKTAPVVTTAGHKAELVKLMRSLQHRHDLWRIFSDFSEMAAVSLANACDWSNPHRDLREARYMEMIKAYRPDELALFPQMLAHLTEALECGMDDVLGEVFMELDLGSKWHGQFFTPFELCRLMAAINIDAMQQTIQRRGFFTVNEPACGGGAMIIAVAEELRQKGLNYQQVMHCTAQDLDIKAVHMAYVQLSLLHIPAVVIHGNTLAVEERSHWYTPAHIMGGWTYKLRRGESSRLPDPAPAPAPAPVPDPEPSIITPIEQDNPLPLPNKWQQSVMF